MRRPTRTRRLSIAAMVSLLAFVVVAGEGVRSFWISDFWNFGRFQCLYMDHGRVVYRRLSGDFFSSIKDSNSITTSTPAESLDAPLSTFKFGVLKHKEFGDLRMLIVWVPIWPLLLLLLVASVCWLIARPANAPAFTVITGASQA